MFLRKLKQYIQAILHCIARILGLRCCQNDEKDARSRSFNQQRQSPPTPPPHLPPTPPPHNNHTAPSTPEPPPHDDDGSSNSFSDGPATCGCGRPLQRGWDCPYCRRNCSVCGRALGVDEDCDRCTRA
ncbi:hypothetical protein O0I10_009672 [Lichtheimia ornata]|uniref:Uncharacterized protein n=1 Tax=Lichtheimia ornata TaxID=688661 RepID=A0AAD7XVS2_9FUNG|nr:uncharacterized protein O0I10_009672 [Lichtheimia ornata]KAJ8654621.1 hypothetical protein O0I10_009672 [Lichtheimia ornata]